MVIQIFAELNKVLTESFSLDDTYGRVWTLAREYSENFSLSDDLITEAIKFLVLSESFLFYDDLVADFTKELSGEAFSLSDDLLKATIKVLSDIANLSDTYSKVWTLARAYSESMSLDDGDTKQIIRILSETTNLSDNLDVLKQILKIYTESFSLSDTYSKVWTLARAYSESIGLSDGDAYAVARILTESFNLSDNLFNLIARELSESQSLSDDLATTRKKIKEFIESFSLDDGTMAFNFIKLLIESFSFDDFFLNIIFDSLKLASERADIQSIITDQGIEATLIRQTETTDTTGAVTAVSEEEYAIYMAIQDILREDRQIHDMGLAFPGAAKVFLFQEYPDSITGNGVVSVQVGDMIKDDEEVYWRVETIKGEREMEGGEVFKSAIIKKVDLDQ